jgi:TusA-related sulfurtransferase
MKRIIVVTAALSLWSGVALAKPAAGGDREGALAGCPSAVPGATTIIENDVTGVILTVTSDDHQVTDEIQRRAHLQDKPDRCPGIVAGTAVAVDEIPDGARLTVRAQSPADVQTLQQTTRARLRDLEGKR